MARRPTEIVAPERVLLGFAIVCVAGMLVVAALARAGSPSTVAIAALGLEALVCVSLAVLVRDLPARLLRPAAMIVAAALTIPVGYFFGPNSSYGALLTLILLFTGIVTARADLPRWAGWLVAGMICLGQLGLVVLTAARVLDDRSLSPLLVERAAWSAVCAHLALQSIYAAAFLLGRAVQRRYHRIVDETIASSRRTLLRTALLAEARGPAQPRTEVVAVAVDRWFESFRSNIRVMDLYTMAIVAFGVILLIAIVRDAFALYLSLASLVVIGALLAWRQLAAPRQDVIVDWPAIAATALSAAPAYGIGLHSGAIAPITLFMCIGRLFRAPNHATTERDHLFVVSACAAHACFFVAVMTGLLGDSGMIAIIQPGAPLYEPYVQHGFVQAAFVLAYIAGRRIDHRFATGFEAARHALDASALAGGELDAPRGAGLFSDTAIGPYRLGRLLGRGGMGEVYRADHVDGAVVALKLVHLEQLRDPATLRRFEHEVAMLMRVESAFCARVLDANVHGDLPYLVMEHIDGGSLSELLRTRELAASEIATLVSDLTRALDDIHAVGLVHLDLKPGNVLQGKRWCVVDFGIAQLISGAASGARVGTAHYMAPEQILGAPVDVRTDLYSAGLVFFRVITGRSAFVDRDRLAGPPDPRSLAPLDEQLALALRIALATDPADRFASAAELRDAMIGALTGRLDERLERRGRELLAREPWGEPNRLTEPEDSHARTPRPRPHR